MVHPVDSAVKNTVQLPTSLFGKQLTWPVTQMLSKTCPSEIGAEHCDVTEEGFSKSHPVALNNF